MLELYFRWNINKAFLVGYHKCEKIKLFKGFIKHNKNKKNNLWVNISINEFYFVWITYWQANLIAAIILTLIVDKYKIDGKKDEIIELKIFIRAVDNKV